MGDVKSNISIFHDFHLTFPKIETGNEPKYLLGSFFILFAEQHGDSINIAPRVLRGGGVQPSQIFFARNFLTNVNDPNLHNPEGKTLTEISLM